MKILTHSQTLISTFYSFPSQLRAGARTALSARLCSGRELRADKAVRAPLAAFRHIFLFFVVISFLAEGPSSFAQGSLTPSSPPAAIMKTLDQIEPRTPVD